MQENPPPRSDPSSAEDAPVSGGPHVEPSRGLRSPGGLSLGLGLVFVPLLLAAMLLLAGPRVAGLLLSSATVSLPAAAIALVLATPATLAIAKSATPWRGPVVALLLATALTPLHVQAAAWLAVVGERGWLDAAGVGVSAWVTGHFGAALLHALCATPIAVVLLAIAWVTVDPRLERQAWLDGSWRAVLGRVTFPAAWPVIAAVGVLIALTTAAEIGVTDLLRVRTFAEEVYTQAATGELLGVSRSAVGAVTRLAAGVAGLAIAAAWALSRVLRASAESARRQADAPSESAWRPRVRGAGLALTLTAIVVVATPMASLGWQAGSEVRSVAAPSDANDSGASRPQRVWSVAKLASEVATAPWRHGRELRVSLALATTVATAATFAAFGMAWWMRSAGGVLRAMAVGMLGLLLATPGPVVGLVVIRVLNQPIDSWLAPLGDLYGTWFAPWLVQTLRATPIAALVIWPAVSQSPRDLLDAARADGAGPWRRAVWVVAPIVWPSLAAAWCVAGAYAFGELSATALVVPPGTPPLSVRVLSLLHYGVEDRVAALCLVVFFALSAVGAVVVGLLSRTRRRALPSPTADG